MYLRAAIVSLSALFILSFGCLGPCPDGFLRDNNNNCIEVDGDDDDGDNRGDGNTNDNNSGNGNNTGNANNGGSSSQGNGNSTLYVVNYTGDDICYLYVDWCGEVSSPDLLGNDILPDGWYIQFNGLDAACYDLWAEDCYGGYWYDYDVQINGEFTWTLLQ